ncbi:MAG: ABC transporter ATP-binding protein [Nitriliruptoraceae bacterium]
MTNGSGARLDIDRLTVSYGSVVAVEGLTLTAAPGQVLAVLGPSGCGKSTLLRAVAGLEPPRGGSIHLDGRRIDGLRPDQRDVGLMFQEHALFPHRSVADNVAFGPRMHGLDREGVRERVTAALALVDLEGLGDRSITELSGGERQRVALARAVAPRPRLLMLDEPLGSIDRALQQRLLTDLRGVFDRLGTTVLHVTHDQQEALAVADHVAVMRAARLEQIGTPDQLWRAPRTAFVARFLGLEHIGDASIRDGVAATPWGEVPLPQAPDGDHEVVLLPGALRLATAEHPVRDHELALRGRVTSRRFVGDHIRVTLAPTRGPALTVPVLAELVPEPGEELELALDASGVHLLEPEEADELDEV